MIYIACGVLLAFGFVLAICKAAQQGDRAMFEAMERDLHLKHLADINPGVKK